MTHLPSLFAALSDQTRFEIVERLMTQGELPAGDLQSSADISAPAISRHLKVLREAGVIQQRAEGTKRFYTVQPEVIQTIASWTLDHRGFWEAGMDRLEAALALEERK